MRSKSIFLVPMFLATPVLAQMAVQAPPTGFSGEIVRYADDSVVLKDKDGKQVTVAMSPGWTVSRPHKVPVTAVKPGDFVASTNKVLDDSSGQSSELRIMEPGYRPEYGTHLMAAASGVAMTHGTVAGVKKTTGSVELNVIYPGGSRRLVVPQDMQITDYTLLSRKTLQPGTKVGAVARKGADGLLRAGRLTLDP